MHRVLWLPAHPLVGAVSMDRYWRELDRQFRRRPPAMEIFSPLGSPPAETREGPRLARVWQKYVAYPRRARRAARAPGVAALHVLDHSFAHLLAGMPRAVRKIATVHDLAPLRHAGTLTPAQVARFRRTVEHLRLADVVLADSRFSADEATEALGLDPAKVRVLPLGVDVEAFARRAARGPAWAAGLEGRRVVLSIGLAIGRKNLAALPAIFRALQGLGIKERLVLLRIGDRLPEALREELRAVLGGSGLVELGRVPDAEVAAAYQRADALLLPSLHEGFGFPVLEAMAAGCPVVCTDVTSLPEVGGGAALYFDPADTPAAAAHLRAVLTDPDARAGRIAAGLRQAAGFTWERHGERLAGIYQGGPAAA